ncbi:hypothetical protein ACOMHN_041274 [Nucella lapillus]
MFVAGTTYGYIAVRSLIPYFSVEWDCLPATFEDEVVGSGSGELEDVQPVGPQPAGWPWPVSSVTIRVVTLIWTTLPQQTIRGVRRALCKQGPPAEGERPRTTCPPPFVGLLEGPESVLEWRAESSPRRLQGNLSFVPTSMDKPCTSPQTTTVDQCPLSSDLCKKATVLRIKARGSANVLNGQMQQTEEEEGGWRKHALIVRNQVEESK